MDTAQELRDQVSQLFSPPSPARHTAQPQVKFAPVQDLWYASETDREMYRLSEGIWARFEYF